jgi:hypothetical protein
MYLQERHLERPVVVPGALFIQGRSNETGRNVGLQGRHLERPYC